jgi:hypothetical protein
MIVMGLDFLNFTPDGFINQYPGYLKVADKNLEDFKPFYFAGLWSSLWLSASLVNPTKYPVVNTYGVVLEIPPQLIVATYQLDSTTPKHSDLLQKIEKREDLYEFIEECLSWEGTYNYEMYTEIKENGEMEFKSRRIFANGESEDSHPFMTPEEMIGRGRPYAHHELKFLPQAIYKNQKYEVKLVALWYKDLPYGHPMARTIADEETVIKLKNIAVELNLSLLPLSQSAVDQDTKVSLDNNI